MEILQRKVNDGKLAEMPPIPTNEWIQLAFHPNNAYRNATSKVTGHLPAKFDQHWVNAMTRYYLEWLVELCGMYNGVEFFG